METDFVTIVSGLPRSGTSMMMRILKAGGKSILADNIRNSDNDNPKGYYEYEPVKKTKQDSSWLNEVGGKAVKMVYRLLYDLPKNYQYRVILMQRDMKEILESQRRMLISKQRKRDNIDDETMGDLFLRELETARQWLEEQHNFSTLLVHYKSILESPMLQCRRINEFMGGGLDIEKMASVIDSSLYRNRS